MKILLTDDLIADQTLRVELYKGDDPTGVLVDIVGPTMNLDIFTPAPFALTYLENQLLSLRVTPGGPLTDEFVRVTAMLSS